MRSALKFLLLVLFPICSYGQILNNQQLTNELNNLVPDNTQKLITPSNMRKVIQDGWNARISVYGNANILGKLTYNSLFPITADGDLIYKAYLEQRLSEITVDTTGDTTGGTRVFKFNDRYGNVYLDSTDLVGKAYPYWSNPLGYIRTINPALIRAMFSPGPGLNYNSSTGQFSFNGTTSDVPEGTNLYYTPSRVKGLLFGDLPIVFNQLTGHISMAGIAGMGTPGQQIRVNTAGTAYEYFTPGASLTTSQAIQLNGPDVIGNGTIGSGVPATIQPNAITTAKINNGAVTILKIGATYLGTTASQTYLKYNGTWGQINWADIQGVPDSVYAGSHPAAETDPYFNNEGVKNNVVYSNPTFIGSLSKTKITGLIDPIQPDWNQASTSALDYIKNKPSIPSAQVPSDWLSTTGPSRVLNKPSFSTVATTGNYSDLIGRPTLSVVAGTGSYTDLINRPTIPPAQVNADWNSTAGSSQILNKPTIPAAQLPADWNATTGATRIINKPNFGAVAFSNSYTDLINRPTIPAAQVNSDWNSSAGASQILNKPNLGVYELTANKSTTMTAPDNFKFPTLKLMSDQLALKQNTISIPSNSLMGRYSTGTGTFQVITLSSDFSIVGGQLVSTGSTGGGNVPDTFQLVVSAPLYFTNGVPDILVDGSGNILTSAEGDTLYVENTSTGRYIGIRGSSHTNRGTMSAYHNRKLDSLIAAVPPVMTELDPTVPSYVKSITLTEKNNWNMAYSWGNHALQGYIKKATNQNITDSLPVDLPLRYVVFASSGSGNTMVLDNGTTLINDNGSPMIPDNGSFSGSGGGGTKKKLVVNSVTNTLAGLMTPDLKIKLDSINLSDIGVESDPYFNAFIAATRTQKMFYGAPNGANGTAGFRLLVASDIPTLTKSKISDFATGVSDGITAAGPISWSPPGTSGTAPNWLNSTTTLGQTQTLNVPMAHTPGVTAGLISYAELQSLISSSGSTTINLGIGSSGTAPNWSASSVSSGGTATINIPLAGVSVISGTISNGTQPIDGQKNFIDSISSPIITTRTFRSTGGGFDFHGDLANNKPSFKINDCSTCANYLSVSPANSGFATKFAAEGSDANIDIHYDAKGGGGHVFNSDISALSISSVSDISTNGNIYCKNVVGNWATTSGLSGTMLSGRGYVSNSSSLLTFPLPSTSAVNDIIRVSGQGTGGWKITQASGQQIHYGSVNTTIGTSGYLQNSNRYDSVELRCITANQEWIVISSQGSLSVN